jgi:hypothetical protein
MHLHDDVTFTRAFMAYDVAHYEFFEITGHGKAPLKFRRTIRHVRI